MTKTLFTAPLLPTGVLALLLAGAVALPLNAGATDPAPGKPVAVVNGVAIPASHAEAIRQERAARGQGNGPGADEAVRDALVNLEILAQVAIQKGLDQPENVRAILELQRKEALVKLLQADFVKTHPIADATIQAEYDKLKAQDREREYRARHILVDNEKTAKGLITQLVGKKAKFEDLAKKHSKDASAKTGGDLGWMTPSSLVPEFAQAMVALKPGEFSRVPVKSQFGWHVIRLEESRQPEFPTFDKVKDQIANHLLQLEYRKYVSALHAAAKVDIPAQ